MELAPDHLAAAVLAACVGGETAKANDEHEISQGFLKNVKIDKDLLVSELLVLRLSVGVYALQTFFKPAVQAEMREAWGRVFHALILKLMGEESEADLNAFIDEVNRRHTQYIEAFTAPVPGWKRMFDVGQVFSKLCGEDKNVTLCAFGASCFGGAMVGVTSLLKGLAEAGAGDVITNLDNTPNIS
jgi:hypothetical protein